jgi:Iap family predicted aminopeptidase
VRLKQDSFQGSLAIVFFDKEEPPHRGREAAGSLNFGRSLKRHPELAIVLDVIGRGDTLLYSFGADYRMLDLLEGVAGKIPGIATLGSDDVLLAQAGVPSVMLTVLPEREIGDPHPPTWDTMHSEHDDCGTVDPDTVYWVADHLQIFSRELLRRHEARVL